MGQLELLQRKLDDLRFRGFGGSVIKMHRAIYQVNLGRSNLLLPLLLPLLFNLLLLCFLSNILDLWQVLFGFWLDKLAPAGFVHMQPVDLGPYMLYLPTPVLSAAMPDSATWWLTLAGSLLLLLATFLIPPRRFLPLTYVVRAALLIQASALAFFYWLPGEFPHDSASYIGDALVMSLFFIFMVPWILGLTYYIFDFPLAQKLALTALVLAYFIVAFPMQYMLHAYALHHLSLLFLPLFYLIFGPFLDIMMFVALYSWGMSWRWNTEIAAPNR
ncbi:MAG TPA: hypothetical protein VN028_03530 [Rhodocyclaceae bacterium]|nr:hypothetical protein [Rhodocyclaceae bacterium]